MSIKAIHTGDNPVKVTKTMMNNLNRFNDRQIEINHLTNEISGGKEKLNELNAKKEEIVALLGSADKKTVKDAEKQLKGVEKEITAVQNEIDKNIVEQTNLRNVQSDILVNMPNVDVSKEVNENDNSLSEELDDISFGLNENESVETEDNVVSNEPEISSVVDNSNENVALENSMVTENVDNQNVESSSTQFSPFTAMPNVDDTQNTQEITPVETTDNSEVDDEIETKEKWPEPEVTFKDEQVENTETPTEENIISSNQFPEFNFNMENSEESKENNSLPEMPEESPKADIPEIPIVPIYDFEEEKPRISEESINKIDALIKNMNESKEGPEENEEVVSEPEKVEEPADDMPEEFEITLKDYVKFASYQEWLFTFAKEVYGRDSFTKEDILNLEKEEGYVSERRFNTARVKQAISLTNENHKLIDKTREAIVARNASQALAKGLTDELNETKNKFEDLSDKYDAQSNKLAETEQELENTKKTLSDTKEELEKTRKELNNFQSTFNKMRGIMENSSSKNEEIEESKKKEA